jgi:hypothetical protein
MSAIKKLTFGHRRQRKAVLIHLHFCTSDVLEKGIWDFKHFKWQIFTYRDVQQKTANIL